ncbi:MAG: hypothetical protein A9Z00_10395 [Thermobacillus sp. ZCTH02-B1]|mgnify:FL=1|uniref:NusG domain II-containing protein n=1 Tax=Thermobacillus sp. ZCTH02-B1 TaxID=1858795 RepID=UPI000B55B693|nr:NusG domain II-containing protein [Thermobacillus sp. ZCTH02-B1]OUM94587.1 MAG: hypothetical protein A9Z00_10395 [Thermobacillus sp. ZCTH02-B1]
MKRGDVWLLAVLAVAVVSFKLPDWLSPQDSRGELRAEIYVDRELYRTVEPKGEPREIEIRTARGVNVLRVSEKGVQMIEADCPDKLCIAMGRIDAAGESIVCLPHRVWVKMVGAPPGGDVPDAIVF